MYGRRGPSLRVMATLLDFIMMLIMVAHLLLLDPLDAILLLLLIINIDLLIRRLRPHARRAVDVVPLAERPQLEHVSRLRPGET